MNIAVVNPERWSEEGLKALEPWHLFNRDYASLDEVLDEVLCVRTDTLVDYLVLKYLPRLKIILSPTTGLDHIDLVECMKRGIKVISLLGECEFLDTIPATAEHTFALILALYRRIIHNHSIATIGRWDMPERGRTLKGKRLGIVGYGRIGKMVHRIAEGFCMSSTIYDPYAGHRSMFCLSVSELASMSDILTLHVPLTPETIGMIGKPVLDALPPNAVLINTSRGAVVNETGLLAALNSGKLSGAALDVIANEHTLNDSHPLLTYARQHDNLILTPHIGGYTVESVHDTDLFIINKLKQWMEANHVSQNNR